MIRKLFVAVHGIGDQKQFDTVQHVARQVLRVAKASTSQQAPKGRGPRISLGTFSSGAGKSAETPLTTSAVHGLRDTFIIQSPQGDYQIAFAEVHWADLCRKSDREGFRLEPTVPWAQTLVDRVEALKAKADASNSEKIDYEMIRAVIGELGDGLHLLGWLTKLAPQLQLPSFEIDDILNQYLGDVQFVTEFQDIREQIFKRFSKTMKGISKTAGLKEGDEIYLITHSEGTVVTLLGLLNAMTKAEEQQPSEVEEQQPPAWLNHIRGWMTIGSPIDKHLILWPELWTKYEEGPAPACIPAKKIVWWNYSDHGDPVGFALDSMRGWMKIDRGAKTDIKRWEMAFEFEEPAKPSEDEPPPHECIFARYAWPGQAHLDYWEDDGLFDHFLGKVCRIGEAPKDVSEKRPILPDHPWNKLLAWLVPYLVAFLVLMSGVFFLDTGIWAAQGLHKGNDLTHFTWEVLSISLLLAGTTVLARMPRLVKVKKRFAVGAFVIFCAFAGLFWITVPPATICYLGYEQGRESAPERGQPESFEHDRELGSPEPARKLLNTAYGRFCWEKRKWPQYYGIRATCIFIALWVALNAAFLQVMNWRWWMSGIYALLLIALVVNAEAQIMVHYFRLPDYSMIPPSWLLASDLVAWFPLWAASFIFVGTMLWTVWENREGHSAGLWPLIAPGVVAVFGIGAAFAMIETPEPVAAKVAKSTVPAAQKEGDNSKVANQTSQNDATKEADSPTLLPFFIGGAAFLFFWKLAAILFDLTFVWHRYIRLNVMMKRLSPDKYSSVACASMN